MTTIKATERTQTPTPVCPHCGHAMDTEEMQSCSAVDLFALAPREEIEAIKCHICDKEFWVKGGYQPHYTTAVAEELL